MTDAFEVLTRDHAEVRQMLSQLEMGPAGQYYATADSLPQRRACVERLMTVASGHEAIEETCLWPAVRAALPDGDELADAAIGQESAGRHTLDRLGELDVGQPEFEALLIEFTRAAREHIDYEENVVWPRLRAALTAEQAEDLGRQLEAAHQAAPTGPHPRLPSGPAV
ncbi:MAG TPA: hemerythrin domain-containing protein [Trebonia sp.]|nr:hemerythrin domain-containing protein [Trebonia sp.]